MENEFNYTYSAPTEAERKEIASIKKHYETPTGESKLERLRRLDAKVKNGANIAALVVGTVGCLIFGAGMAMVLEFNELVWGIILSAAGIAPIAAAYPLYSFVLKKNKKKYGAEILKLSQELLNEKEN